MLPSPSGAELAIALLVWWIHDYMHDSRNMGLRCAETGSSWRVISDHTSATSATSDTNDTKHKAAYQADIEKPFPNNRRS